jgi:hypothetical protein
VNAAQVPEDVVRLLWDVDVARFDLERDRALVIERVMGRGTWEAMKWLRRSYPNAVLAEFVRSRGPRVLAPRDLAYWALMCGVDLPQTAGDAGGGRPRWAGA